MKKKFIHINLVMMIAVLFATCYQSIHVFSHEIHNDASHHCCDDSHSTLAQNIAKTAITENEDCPVCDFKFAGFLAPEIYIFNCSFTHIEIPYSFNYEAHAYNFWHNANFLRGPPC